MRLPEWFRRQLPRNSSQKTWSTLKKFSLNTVCESALCPNRSDCYSHGTATFMILGNRCTRRCGFCAIETAKPDLVEDDEPQRVTWAAEAMGLRYVVITSVARDDLQDEGAEHFYRCVKSVKEQIAGVEVEVLTPDFHAHESLIGRVCEAEPTVYNHNLETVARLQRQVRPQAGYDRSLKVINFVKINFPKVMTKSGLMLGLGETQEEVLEAAGDLREAGCEILTVGQYLAPSEKHLPVVEFIPPEVFESLADRIRQLGFSQVYAGPYVRSSYHAAETFLGIEERAR